MKALFVADVFVSGVSGITDAGKKKILLLKGKEKEIPTVSIAFLFVFFK